MKWLMRIVGKENKERAGFTLVELMVVVIIVGILAAAAIPIYRFAMKKAYMSEAQAALGSIRAAEQVHYAEYSKFKAVVQGDLGKTISLGGLDIDVSKNTWFNSDSCFKVDSGSDDAFTAYCSSTTASGAANTYDIYVSLDQAGAWGYPATDPCPPGA